MQLVEGRLQRHYELARQFSPSDIERARAIVPVERLRQQAQTALESVDYDKEELKAEQICEVAAITRQCLQWFKEGDDKFPGFTWFHPHCGRCDRRLKGRECIGRAHPTPEELRVRAQVVEVWRCCDCSCTLRFPRVNSAIALLEKYRTGRCGEFAQAFALVLLACFGEERVRLVNDWTDHVWCEVRSDALDRWLHCDPCEAALDTPLLYSRGWGKKLHVVVAFTCGFLPHSDAHCIDVSPRYTVTEAFCSWTRDVKPRRRQFRGLRRALERKQLQLCPQKSTLCESLLKQEHDELQQLCRRSDVTNCDNSDNNGPTDAEKARQSGDTDWIRQRGEDGQS
ncbi:MAG: hypothetical protein MHM6MM_002569 [Cercozoa sp. M6MM]